MHRTLSEVDIATDPVAWEIYSSEDEQQVKEMLYIVGFDVDKPYELVRDTHRPMSQRESVTANRFVGSERQDLEWVESGYCTKENKMEMIGKKDVHLQRELLNMSRSPQYSAALVESMKSGVQDVEMKFVEEKEDEE